MGHVVEGTSKFYEDGVDATYLIDLVNIVGKEYFGGEQVDVQTEENEGSEGPQ